MSVTLRRHTHSHSPRPVLQQLAKSSDCCMLMQVASYVFVCLYFDTFSYIAIFTIVSGCFFLCFAKSMEINLNIIKLFYHSCIFYFFAVISMFIYPCFYFLFCHSYVAAYFIQLSDVINLVYAHCFKAIIWLDQGGHQCHICMSFRNCLFIKIVERGWC